MPDLAEARRLLAVGRIAEAERAFQRALDAEPQNGEALGGLAEAALRQGDAERAMELLRRAVLSAPSAAIHQHLGRAHALCADFASAVDAYATAVRLDPALFTARLHLATSLERVHRLDAAMVQYKRALDDAQRQGQWLDQSSTPPLLRPLIEHAVIAVRRNRHAVFDRLFAPLRARYGADSLARVEHCVGVFLNERAAEYPDPRQRPSFLFFPGLPTCAYFERAIFPWIDSLEAATGAIHAELEPLLRSDRGRERVLADDQQEAASLQGAEEPPSWTGYYFYRHGVRRDENCAACPSTARALDALPLCRIREHGPEVHFSVFTAGTRLLPHRGVTNTRVVGHLPLIIPDDCALSVGGEIHQWKRGRVVVFDDTFEHEAWNRSRTTRVILIFDAWNPFLAEIERAALTELVAAIGDFRHAVERA
ncbi:MAG: aspartyl/asparaginyl beta-hydroxylase domain-containing protein [Steroidobacteraceae bacterium]